MPKKRRKKRITDYESQIMNDDKTSGRGAVKKGGKAAVKILTALDNEESQGAISARHSDDGKSQFNQGKEEQKKKLIMWLGIGGVMLVFFVAWIFNLKYEFKASLKKGADNGFNWSQTKTELDKAMKQVKQGLDEVKKIQENLNLKQNTLSDQPKLTPEQINLLKSKLLDEIDTGTASSTRK